MSRVSADFLKEHPIAHRGFFDNTGAKPENSLAAVLEAVNQGFAAELDVMLSSDGEVMVFHDDSLERMCSRSELFTDMSAIELQNLRLGNSGEGIPTLARVLAFVQGQRPLVIELKSFSRNGNDTNGRLERKVAELLMTYQGPVALKSFNPFSVTELLRLRTASDKWPVGFISCNHRKDPDFAFLSPEQLEGLTNLRPGIAPDCEFISYNINDLTDELSQRVRAQMPLIVWTVRTEEQFNKASRLADNVVFEWRGVKPRTVP
ncbi:MAG: glycerophosphodiester phosphodiesterase family protein [Silvanigrellaceae bacterium]